MKKVLRFGGVLVFGFIFSPCNSFAAENRTTKLYELYNSTSTPQVYKQLLKQRIDRHTRVEKLCFKAKSDQNAAPAFKLGDFYAIPNPAMGIKHPIIHIETGLADKIEIKIYSPDGSLKEEAVVTAPAKVINGLYIYEYRFASDTTPYGTCIYTVKAFKAGASPVEGSGKMIFVNTGY
ncbi:MAG: hypothetical protein A2081_03320 [Elusimicrobia bacterium GWC2_61_19]|nr:MAG: hypothetical protein A2081_03320 [Elusimicrobia bacterium GWC2_61_19]